MGWHCGPRRPEEYPLYLPSVRKRAALISCTYPVFLKCVQNLHILSTYCNCQIFSSLASQLFVPPQNILTKSHKLAPRVLELPQPTLIHCKMGMNRSASVWMAIVAALSSWALAERIVQAIGRAPDVEEAYKMFCCITD